MRALGIVLIGIVALAAAQEGGEGGGEGGEGGGEEPPVVVAPPEYYTAFVSGSFQPAPSFTAPGSPATPHAVWGSSLVYANTTGLLYTFGGEAAASHLAAGAFLSFDPRNAAAGWKWLTGTSNLEAHCDSGVCTFPAIGATGNPPVRYGHGSAFDYIRNSVWLFGGKDKSTGGFWNDLWEYMIDSGLWYLRAGGPTTNVTRVSSGPSANPGSRFTPYMFMRNGKPHVYGGAMATDTGNPYTYSDMWQFDVTLNGGQGQWVLLSANPDSLEMNAAPLPYVPGPITSIVNDAVVANAGCVADSVFAGFSIRHPGGRYGAVVAYDPIRDRLLLFGGLGSASAAFKSENPILENEMFQPNSDVWEYAFDADDWAWYSGYKSWGQAQTWDVGAGTSWLSKNDLINTCGYACFGSAEHLAYSAGAMMGTQFFTIGGAQWESNQATWNFDPFATPVRAQKVVWAYNFTQVAFNETLGDGQPYFSQQYPECNGGCQPDNGTWTISSVPLTNNTPTPQWGAAIVYVPEAKGAWVYGGCQINQNGHLYNTEDPSDPLSSDQQCTTQLYFITANPYLCSDSPCLNGGTCTDGIGFFTCECAAGFTGEHCQSIVTPCESNPCQNGGTCLTLSTDSYSCACATGYSGTWCQILTPHSSSSSSSSSTGGSRSSASSRYRKEDVSLTGIAVSFLALFASMFVKQ